MAGFPLFTDNHVRQQIIKALGTRDRDVVRAVNIFGERTDDEELLAWAAQDGRAFMTSDDGIHAIAHEWLREGRS